MGAGAIIGRARRILPANSATVTTPPASTSTVVSSPVPVVKEQMVTIAKVEGKSLGLGLSPSLRIAEICTEGLILDWNRENPSKQVQQDDQIVEVNGIRGDASAMFEAMQSSETLQMLIRCTGDLHQEYVMMQYRGLKPEDYELLSLLDEAINSKTAVQHSFLVQLPKAKAHSCGIDKCSICLNECDMFAEVTQLPCQHYFCTYCIEKWLTECGSRCPLCLTMVDSTEAGPRSDPALHFV